MEHQKEFGIEMYDFGAKNYDPELWRWMNLDPYGMIPPASEREDDELLQDRVNAITRMTAVKCNDSQFRFNQHQLFRKPSIKFKTTKQPKYNDKGRL